jgi:hypothetical protein
MNFLHSLLASRVAAVRYYEASYHHILHLEGQTLCKHTHTHTTLSGANCGCDEHIFRGGKGESFPRYRRRVWCSFRFVQS